MPLNCCIQQFSAEPCNDGVLAALNCGVPQFSATLLSESYFFSRFPLISNSCLLPPNSAAPFPLSLSPSTVNV